MSIISVETTTNYIIVQHLFKENAKIAELKIQKSPEIGGGKCQNDF